MRKRLYKTDDGKKLCGVCAGIAEYFNIDPTIVRLILIIFCLAGGSGILFYIIAALVMPNKTDII
ncbi:MAG: PspC domain-containing protein [Clostridia bacterium]|nr:PspC domain-containing protein [Clostridia bacterium]